MIQLIFWPDIYKVTEENADCAGEGVSGSA